MRPSALPTSMWSGVTRPCTTASPQPQLVSMTTRSVLPVTGWAENATPAARTAAAAASISAASAPAPSPPRAVSATSASPACSQCRRNASTVTVNPLGRFTPARYSSASRPILAPQTPIAWSGAMSSTQAMAPDGVMGSGTRSASPVRCLLDDGHPAGAAIDLDVVPVGDDHRGQAGRGDGGHTVLAADDGGVGQGAAAVAHAGG